MKKEDILKALDTPRVYKGITEFENLILKRFDILIEVLTDIRNALNNGKDG